jgi:hypothetical protein
VRVIGERVGRQAGWQVITHSNSLRSGSAITPGIAPWSRWKREEPMG